MLKLTPLFPKSNVRIISVLALSNIFQAGISWLALIVDSPLFAGGCLVLGGGLLGATTYPLVSLIVFRFLERQEAALRRQIMLILALSADVGQILGAGLMLLPKFSKIPLEVVLVPIVGSALLFIKS